MRWKSRMTPLCIICGSTETIATCGCVWDDENERHIDASFCKNCNASMKPKHLPEHKVLSKTGKMLDTHKHAGVYCFGRWNRKVQKKLREIDNG